MSVFRSLYAVAICSLLAACSTTPQKSVDAATQKQTTVTSSQAQTKMVVNAETETQKLERIAKVLANKSVYFDYDNFTIKTEYQDLLKQDADHLRSLPLVALRLEGNTDERGSTEYNLALGQKRADAVKRVLTMLGVSDASLESISYGKEKPRTDCHEEKCWAENRRVDLIASKPSTAK